MYASRISLAFLKPRIVCKLPVALTFVGAWACAARVNESVRVCVYGYVRMLKCLHRQVAWWAIAFEFVGCGLGRVDRNQYYFLQSLSLLCSSLAFLHQHFSRVETILSSWTGTLSVVFSATLVSTNRVAWESY